jgi:hypothetical protein
VAEVHQLPDRVVGDGLIDDPGALVILERTSPANEILPDGLLFSCEG